MKENSIALTEKMCLVMVTKMKPAGKIAKKSWNLLECVYVEDDDDEDEEVKQYARHVAGTSEGSEGVAMVFHSPMKQLGAKAKIV